MTINSAQPSLEASLVNSLRNSNFSQQPDILTPNVDSNKEPSFTPSIQNPKNNNNIDQIDHEVTFGSVDESQNIRIEPANINDTAVVVSQLELEDYISTLMSSANSSKISKMSMFITLLAVGAITYLTYENNSASIKNQHLGNELEVCNSHLNATKVHPRTPKPIFFGFPEGSFAVGTATRAVMNFFNSDNSSKEENCVNEFDQKRCLTLEADLNSFNATLVITPRPTPEQTVMLPTNNTERNCKSWVEIKSSERYQRFNATVTTTATITEICTTPNALLPQSFFDKTVINVAQQIFSGLVEGFQNITSVTQSIANGIPGTVTQITTLFKPGDNPPAIPLGQTVQTFTSALNNLNRA